MKMQFGLVDPKLKEKGLTRDSATAEQLADALSAVADAELDVKLADARAKAEIILIEEQARKAARERG